MVATNALPLIPPVDNKMSMVQCESEISRLRAIHHQEIEKFWRAQQVGLPKGKAPALAGVKRDLYQLKQVRAPGVPMFDEPSGEICRNAWSAVVAQVDPELRERMGKCSSAELVGIVSNDEEILLIHKVEGDWMYGDSSDSIHIGNEGDSNQFLRVWHFEPDPSVGSPYFVPCLYLIGTVPNPDGAWSSKFLASSDRYALESKVESMERLLEGNGLPKETYSTCLPSFSSGVESQLHELETLRNWLSQKGSAVKEERDKIDAATAGIKAQVAAKRAELQALEDQLTNLNKDLEVARASEFLKFYGFELGQLVEQAGGRLTGTLGLDRRSDVVIELPDGGVTSRSTHQVKSEIRRGEWLAVEDQRSIERQRC